MMKKNWIRVVMFSACHFKKFASFIVVAFFASYIRYADIIFSLLLFFLGFIYLILCFNFYIRHMNANRDNLLDVLEKKGR